MSHNLWQFPGNWLQIANYNRYSNFEAIFKMPCLFTSKKVQKITHSAQKRMFKLLFFQSNQKALATDFWNSIFGGCVVIDCISTFLSQYYFVLILFYMLKWQGIPKMAGHS